MTDPTDSNVTLIDHDLRSLDPDVGDPVRVVHERAAYVISIILLSILGLTVVLQLALCFYVIWSGKDLKESVELVHTLLVACEHYVAAVLLPLLAFALGYFFGTHK